jgi:transposase
VIEARTSQTQSELVERVAQLEAELAAARAERDRLRQAYQQLLVEADLLRRKIFVAKAERIDTRQLELEFANKNAQLMGLASQLQQSEAAEAEPSEPSEPSGHKPKNKHTPKGRRNLHDASLQEERFEYLDEQLEGKAERIDFELSYKLGWRKGGPVRIVIARAKYRVVDEDGSATLVTTWVPRGTFGRTLAAPSLLAKILTDKFCDGLPLFRQEQRFEREGISIDRGTMSRWAEDAGMTAGCVVLAMKNDALQNAFCISTDATGVAVQPEPSPTGARQACRHGHFFVLLADRDHVLFEYMPRETSPAVAEMLRGYSGYVQADAKSVYDILFRTGDKGVGDDAERQEVACWSHARRRFYEAAISSKDKVAREALFRIHKLFELERKWSGLPPSKRKDLRDAFSRPIVEQFMAWAQDHYERVKDRRGLLRSAFGYVVRQREALSRFLDDGRLRLENNASERELRRIAVGRKAWLFVGSDDHAEAAANIFSLVASCKLHRIDAESYLRDLFRVLSQWPRDRYLELAPKYWAATRARLDPAELARPLGRITIPAPPTQESPADCSR